MEIIISEAGNGLIFKGKDVMVFELSPGKKPEALRKLLENVAESLSFGFEVAIEVSDPSGTDKPSSSIKEPEWLSVKQVADKYGVAEGTLQEWRSQSLGPIHSKIGRSIRYRRRDLEKYFNDNIVRTTES